MSSVVPNPLPVEMLATNSVNVVPLVPKEPVSDSCVISPLRMP